MVSPRLGFLAVVASLLSALVVVTPAAASALAPRQGNGRDTTYAACDNEDGTIPGSGTWQTGLNAWDSQPSAADNGHHMHWPQGGGGHHHHAHHNGDATDSPLETTDDPVFYVAPGYGSCEFNYTDADPGVCLNPGWVRSAHANGCNKWVEVELPALGTSAYARVLDACGAVPNSTFGCNDAYLTLSTFSALVQGNASIIADGRTPGPVRWRFTNEPCFACWEGLPGKLPDGRVDTCRGPDDSGFLRDGRKEGSAVLTSADAGAKCAATTSGLQQQQQQQQQQQSVKAQQMSADGEGKPKSTATTTTTTTTPGDFKQQVYTAFGGKPTANSKRWNQGRGHVLRRR